jgi:hypothetical protein
LDNTTQYLQRSALNKQLRKQAEGLSHGFRTWLADEQRYLVPPLQVAFVATLSPEPTSVQPDQTPAGPPGSEIPWVSSLLSEFSEVFQDPLPAGLPLERSEGHSIPTEPGHPPPVRSMYHLSLLEYRELEKQVTKFLKDFRYPRVLTVLLSCLCQSLTVEACVCVLTIKL